MKQQVTEFYHRMSYFYPTEKGKPKKQLDKTGKELHPKKKNFFKKKGKIFHYKVSLDQSLETLDL